MTRALLMVCALFGLVQGNPPKEPQKEPQEVKKQVVASYRGRVTAGYLRMHAPEMVLGTAREVQAGRLPATTLQRYVGPKTAQALLVLKSDPVSRTPIPRTEIPRPRVAPAVARKSAPGQGESGLGQILIDRGLFRQGWIVDSWPDTLQFPALYEGGRADLQLIAVSPADGPVTASLPVDLNFSILEMRVYDGTLKEMPGGSAQPGIVASKTSAPWTLPTSAGQSVGVVVRYMPKFNLFKNIVGEKASKLELTGKPTTGLNPTRPSLGSWKVEIPIRARFQGVNLGVIAFAKSSEIAYCMPPSYAADLKYFQGEVTLINAKEAITGKIEALNLPKGVTMQPINVSLGKQETKTVKITFGLDPQKRDGPWFGPYESPWNITLRARFGERESTLGYYLLVYPSEHVWYADSVDVGSCSVSGTLVLDSEGNLRFTGGARNSDPLFSRTVTFHGFLNGTQYVGTAATVPAYDYGWASYKTTRLEFKDNYPDFIHKPFTMNVIVTHPGL